MANALSRRLRTTLFYALRTAFRLTPLPQGARDRLRECFLDTKGHWVPEAPKGQAPTGELPRRPYVRSDERAIGYVPYEKGELPDPLPATLVAFYLPQFHTIPENDDWWGKGFTEWRNVTRALPQFEGHYQPKLPGDLGFYDLRNVEVMHEQARLAREYGISAFCFYFYWFGGKTLLETPLRNWLNDKTIDLKFCLCWANEKWTRTWDGRGDQILIDQQHSPEDDIAFIDHVAEYMRDPRYLRVDGKPVLLVYRPGLLRNAEKTAKAWRERCEVNGIGEIHLAYVQSFDSVPPSTIDFDAAVEFPPSYSAGENLASSQRLLNPSFSGDLMDWRLMAEHFQNRAPAKFTRHACVNPGWDNQARRPGGGRTFLHASPRGYYDWLLHSIEVSRKQDRPSEPLVFINAWNEWAEGAVLEPDARLGYAYLERTRQAVTKAGALREPPKALLVNVVIHAWYLDVLEELLIQLDESGLRYPVVITTPPQHATAVRALVRKFSLTCTIETHENRGRDILPFLHVCERLFNEGVDIVLKLHTKQSVHRADGGQWRRSLVEGLIGEGKAQSIVEDFTNDCRLGLVGPAAHMLPLTFYWGANQHNTEGLASRIGLPTLDKDSGVFASGSMFWVRLKAIQPILDSHLEPCLFEEESNQKDGTLAHALERIFAHVCTSTGFLVKSTNDQHTANQAPPSRYRHASRSHRPT
ncbi:glycoside hydrolase family 99-like domain-containing protein [Pseudoxanthomonas mexicana]|uniref:glycoside hydrolase family 99-like domain-containing protein n=1 Tax=Pseudoxanthomonas mexicana TaxID=128785 RepID=UPI0024E1C232|nr:glycoside hydrolase family 99-like domain-containing protein [Pseudoxanthomonas mexicana]